MKTFSAIMTMLCFLSASALLADDQELTREEVMELGQPGEEHERLAVMVGSWNTEMKMFLPEFEEPLVSEGSAEFELILDGRFLVQDFEGDIGGTPFSGHGMSGYDRIQEKYIGTWMDSFNTGMMTLEGTYDEEADTMTEVGTTVSPTGEDTMKYVTEYHSDDEFFMTIYMVGADGTDTKLMEITYTRAEEGDE